MREGEIGHERGKEIDIGEERRGGEMRKIGGSGCEEKNKKNRLVEMESERMLKQQERKRERGDNQQPVDRDPELTLKLAHQLDSDSSIIQFTLYLTISL